MMCWTINVIATIICVLSNTPRGTCQRLKYSWELGPSCMGVQKASMRHIWRMLAVVTILPLPSAPPSLLLSASTVLRRACSVYPHIPQHV